MVIGALRRHVTVPAYNLLSRETSLGRIAMLRRSQWWPAERLREYQLARVKALVEHAYRTTAHYSRAMAERGITPGDIRTLDDVASLPILSKKEVQEHLDELVSSAFDRAELVHNASSGSTGVVTQLYHDQRRNRLRRADVYRHNCWTGWCVGEPMFSVWGGPTRHLNTAAVPSRIRDMMVGTVETLNAFEITEEGGVDFLRRMSRQERFGLTGYASGLDRLADVAMRHREISCRPTGIISSAETLTDEARRKIEDAFGARVFNRYGSREVGLIASECGCHDGMHINAENVLVEVVSDASYEGKSGRAIITDLENYGMPMIRYDLGDVIELSDHPCFCTRGLPLLKRVSGRVSAFILCADGRRMSGEFFSYFMHHYSGIREFRIVQKADRSVTIEVVKLPGCDEQGLEGVLEKARNAIGQGIPVSCRQVEAIHVPPSGKYQYAVSECV